VQVGFGAAGLGAPGLALSAVLADVLAGLNLLRLTRHDVRAFIAEAQWERLKQLAVEYRDFPAYSATQNLLNALSSGLPVLLLTHYFGIAVAGAYAFGLRLIEAPMSLVMGALRQVLFQRAGEMQHQGLPLSPLFLKSTAGLFGLGAAPALLLAWSAPRLFGLVFGAQWSPAGEFARYLVVWLLFVFCNLPSVLFARLIRIQRAVFVFNLVLLAARASALIAGGMYLTAMQTVVLFSAVGAVMNVVLIILVGQTLLRREGDTLSPEAA
jgi:O-antigen/teichoic acid export membrane protein